MAISYFGTGMGRGVLRHTAIFLVLGFSLDAGVSETVAGCAFIQRVFFLSSANGFERGGHHSHASCKCLSVQQTHKLFHDVVIKITGKLKIL